MSAFMIPEYHEDYPWEVINENWDSFIVPSFLIAGCYPELDDFSDYIEGKPMKFKRMPKGVVHRLSAPGYLDCTDWNYSASMRYARASIAFDYEVDPDTGEELADDE